MPAFFNVTVNVLLSPDFIEPGQPETLTEATGLLPLFEQTGSVVVVVVEVVVVVGGMVVVVVVVVGGRVVVVVEVVVVVVVVVVGGGEIGTDFSYTL